MEERRTFHRHQVYLPAEIEGQEGKFQVGITQDMSRSGALLLTRAKIDTGEDIRVYFMLQGGEREAIRGKVVRKRHAQDKGIWSLEVAVAFSDCFSSSFEQRLSEISESQASIFGS